MFRMFSSIRKSLLSESRFSRYLVYAIGEIILLVIGILLALQINNWNEEKHDQQAIKGYLNTISRNIQSDLNELEKLRSKREYVVSRAPLYYQISYLNEELTRGDITYISDIYAKIVDLKYLLHDSSGFESLKFSGYLSKLQGTDIESLLYQYYNLVSEITSEENEFNANIRDMYSSFLNITAEHIYFFNIHEALSDNNILEMQNELRNILLHQSINRAFDHVSIKSPRLIVMYDNLNIIGEALMFMLKRQQISIDETIKSMLSDQFDIGSSIGYPNILINSSPMYGFYSTGYAHSDGRIENWIEHSENELQYQFDGGEWGVQFISLRSGTGDLRPNKDYSIYSTIELELKAPNSGDIIELFIKDKDDPDDGSETQIPLTLTDNWETYRIPLSEFKTADLKKLYVVIGFVFKGEPQTVSVRNVRYIK